MTPSSASPSTRAPSPIESGQSEAEAFVSDWFGALSLAMVSGETATVRELSADTCASCDALADQIESIYANGGSVETSGWSVEESQATGEADGSPSFLLRVRQGERTLRDGNKVVDQTPMTKIPMSVELSGGPGSWQVRQLVILK